MSYFLLLIICFIPVFGFSSNVDKMNDYLDSNDAVLARVQQYIHDLKVPDRVAASLPARLGFATFGSQNAFLASSQAVTDHLDQKRFAPQARKSTKSTKYAANSVDVDELLVNASENMGRSKKCESKPCHSKGHLTGWLSPFGEYAHEKPQPDVAAFSFDVGGAIAGLDYNTVDNDVIGFGGAYVFTHVWEDANAGDANINQGFLGVYTLLHAMDWYFNMSLWGGYYHTNNTRNILTFATTQSTTHGWQLAPHAEIGYEGYVSRVCAQQWFGVGPFILADWVANWEHGFKEHGGGLLNMQINGRFCSLLRGETGLRFHETVSCSWGDVVFQQKGSYAYQKMFGTGTITSSFVGASSTFTVNTLIYAQNLGVFEFSVLFKPIDHKWPFGNIRYQGEFGSRYQSHQGIVEIGKDF